MCSNFLVVACMSLDSEYIWPYTSSTAQGGGGSFGLGNLSCPNPFAPHHSEPVCCWDTAHVFFSTFIFCDYKFIRLFSLDHKSLLGQKSRPEWWTSCLPQGSCLYAYSGEVCPEESKQAIAEAVECYLETTYHKFVLLAEHCQGSQTTCARGMMPDWILVRCGRGPEDFLFCNLLSSPVLFSDFLLWLSLNLAISAFHLSILSEVWLQTNPWILI